MIIRRQLLITSLILLGLNTASAAQSPPTSGVIRFSGQIVESTCTASGASSSLVELSDCPQASRGQMITVQNATARNTTDPKRLVFTQIVADTHDQEIYYDQRLLLTDSSGMRITTGNYLVTLTLP